MKIYDIFKAKILIIDNHKDKENSLLENILTESGYKKIKSINQINNIKIEFQKFKPDLVLLNLVSSIEDNKNIFKSIKLIKRGNNNLFFPILAIIENNDNYKLEAIENEVTDFLVEPHSNKLEVINRINNYIYIKLLNNDVMKQNKYLKSKIMKTTLELEDIQFEIINRLSRAIEYRDNETGIHVTRMSLYCEEVAKHCNLSEKECKLLLHASKLHDIGKIAIPDDILLKTDKLTNEEFDYMKTHTNIGREILSGSKYEILKIAYEIAVTHHEKWDGTGYPNGLKGEEIPLVGRIASICDVFDALTSVRPYKQSWSIEEAITEIQNQKEKHFDPEIVEIFIKILPKIIEIKDKHPDNGK